MVWGIQLFRFEQNISKISSLENKYPVTERFMSRLLTTHLKLCRLFSPELLRDSKNKYENIKKEEYMAYLKALSQYLTREAKKYFSLSTPILE